MAAIETQFHHFVRTVPPSGRLVVNAEEASLARVLARGCWSEVERFGDADADHAGADAGAAGGECAGAGWCIDGEGTVTSRRSAPGCPALADRRAAARDATTG